MRRLSLAQPRYRGCQLLGPSVFIQGQLGLFLGELLPDLIYLPDGMEKPQQQLTLRVGLPGPQSRSNHSLFAVSIVSGSPAHQGCSRNPHRD